MGPQNTDGFFGSADAGDLEDLLLDSQDIHDFLGALTVYLADFLSTADNEAACSVTLLREGSAATVASSSAMAAAMDEIQYAHGDGPCFAAARNGVTAFVPDVENVVPADHEWRAYLSAAASHGIRSILAVPFLLKGEAQAALNLYAPAPQAFDPSGIAVAERHAAQASPVLRMAIRSAQLTDTMGDLQKARESRTIINVAVGILMIKNRCTEEEALHALHTGSSARRVTLQVLAADIVSSITTGQA